MPNRTAIRASILMLFVFATTAPAQTPRIDPAGIDGALLLCGSYAASPEALDKFVELAGGSKAKIVILIADKAKWGAPPLASLTDITKKKDAAAPVVADYSDAKNVLKDATGVWLHVDSTSSWGQALKKQSIADECKAVLQRGGVIASAAAGVRYVGVKELAVNGSPCLHLLPDGLVESLAKQKTSRLLKAQNSWQGLVAYEIDADAAMLVKGRTISVVGPGGVQIYVASRGNGPPREIKLQGKDKEDLTALRRNAFDHAHSFPPTKVEPPFVAKGTLVIVGGGGQPANLYQKFIEYAGGEGKANIVIFPTAADPIVKRDSIAAAFKKAGAKKATVLYGKTQAEVESKEFLDTLKEATGLWFDGGRQWRFVDCYENTKALPLMFDVLQRGGVIGGTSAGATIQGEYLARGGVFNNFDIRYPGYERGLGFLKGVAIDQHFTQRQRLKDMTQLMKVYPQFLGIGIDEATAIVVKGNTADIIGKGKVHFYDANRKIDKGQPDYQALTAGGRYDLKERKIISAK